MDFTADNAAPERFATPAARKWHSTRTRGRNLRSTLSGGQVQAVVRQPLIVTS
jgi:hypothetical protein